MQLIMFKTFTRDFILLMTVIRLHSLGKHRLFNNFINSIMLSKNVMAYFVLLEKCIFFVGLISHKYVLHELDMESQFLDNVFSKLNFCEIKTMLGVLRIEKINDKKNIFHQTSLSI